ncbi:MAG: carbohydrate kinase family protein [Ruminococcus sp.]|nr:carbohydrate kinase family protein [Ruminococcus sp.]
MEKKETFLIIGASVLDILAQPVDTDVFQIGSVCAEHSRMHTGGDALNEATVLSALGADVRLISKWGTDYAGNCIQVHCRNHGIDTSFARIESSLETGINLVLVDSSGERHFITSKHGSLRKLHPQDIPGEALSGRQYLCFASIFVFPAFDDTALAKLFAKAKSQGLILCADMTKRKNGETLSDMKRSLALLDFIFPNYEEARLLTEQTDYDDIADAFLSCNVGCVVLKAGAKGCFLKTTGERHWIPPYPNAHCLDTTGAGDTFTACFLYAHSLGMSLRECGQFANAGASICIEQIGATGGIRDAQQVWERYRNC